MSGPPRVVPPPDQVARDVLDNLLEGCQVIGPDFTYRYVNDRVVAQGRRSRDELLGRTMMACYPGIDETPMFAVLRRCMVEHTHARMENEFTLPDGTKGWFLLRFVPVPEGVCILSLDVTDERRAAETLQRTEEQLRHAQKMEAVGRLAGGVAHDFNNLLSVILSYSETIHAELPPDHALRADVDEITIAGRRAAELTKQLLTFSRRQAVAPRVLDLNEVLASMDRMLQRVLGDDVDLVSRPASPLGRVRADPGSLEQVVMNLVVNARDAMPTGGKLTMETGDVVLDEAYAREHVGVTPGPHVMLAITDSGQGMDAATQARIFEPFFTTKASGRGTGLGLSTVFGIVQQCGGHVWVYSEPGRGTTFKIYLPRVDAEVEGRAAIRPPTDVRGTETLLLVEDDAQLRVVAADMLRKAGYHVLSAAHPEDALLQAGCYPGPIHLVVSDVIMPGMSGPELVRRLAQARPGLKVLCMSGYTDDVVVRHGLLEAEVAYLQKPITRETLTTKVREVLDARGSQPG